MKNYCGNKDPFVFVICDPADLEEARAAAEALSQRTRVYLASALGKRERRALEKAAALFPVLGKGPLALPEEAAALASAGDKALLPIFLEKPELTPGLRLLLSGTQRVYRGDYADREAFLAALCGAPLLEGLSVSPEQKRAGRRGLLASLGGLAVLAVLALLLLLRPLTAQRIDPASPLGQLGLSGRPGAIRTVALYGGTLEKEFEEDGVYQAYVSVVNNMDLGGLYLPAADKVDGMGTLTDLSDFTQLTNLEELSLAGNSVEDIRPLFSLKKLKKLDLSNQFRVVQEPDRREVEGIHLSLEGIGALENLETLYVAWNSWPEENPAWLAELDTLPRFRTLVLDRGAEILPALLSTPHAYEIRLLGAEVGNLEELRAAAGDPDCHCIFLRQGAEILIPAGEECTLPRNVMLSGAFATIRVQGTLRVRGWVECGMTTTQNQGTLVVEEGGSFIGGMSDVFNEGRFVVEEGGLHSIERGMEFWQRSGSYVNNGTQLVCFGGVFHFEGGTAENNGRIIVEDCGGQRLPTPTWYEDKLNTAQSFTGSGTVSFEPLSGAR